MAARKAEEFLAQRQTPAALPIDPFEIARELEIVVQAKPATAAGVSGILARNGDTFGILYATHIASEGYQRFSVAHELGHYLLPGHIDHVLPDTDGILGELRDELAGVQREVVSAAAIQRAVALFDPVWDLLLVPERFRILHLLLESVGYDGSTGELELAFYPLGITSLAAEAAMVGQPAEVAA